MLYNLGWKMIYQIAVVMVFLVLLAKSINDLLNKYLDKQEIILYKKKNQNDFAKEKKMYDCKRYIIGAYIRNFFSVRQKFWPINSLQTGGQTNRLMKTGGPSVVMPLVNFIIPLEKLS